MEIKDICADLVIEGNALKALITVLSDTFTSGTSEDMIRSVTAQPGVFSYLVYVIGDYAHSLTENLENLESCI